MKQKQAKVTEQDKSVRQDDGVNEELLFRQTIDSLNFDMDFCMAIAEGDVDLVKRFLADERVNPSCNKNGAINVAAERGHLEVVKLLLSDGRADPACLNDKLNNKPIHWAASRGHTEVVKLLLADSRVNPAVDNNYAIRQAATNGHFDVILSLLEHPAVLTYVRENLQNFISNYPAVQNTLRSTHAQYNEAFRKAFFSMVSKEFMATMPVHDENAKKSSDGIELINYSRNLLPPIDKLPPQDDFIIEEITYDQPIEPGLENNTMDVEVKANNNNNVVNHNAAFLPLHHRKVTEQGKSVRQDDGVKEELSYRQTKKPRVDSNEMDVENKRTTRKAFLDFGHWS